METQEGATGRVIYGWLLLSVLALAFAGLFALLIALARTPVVEHLLPFGRDYIYVALVGHVVLAFVIWFLAFEGFLWFYTGSFVRKARVPSPALGHASLVLSGAGIALVVVSAVFGLGRAEVINYVPALSTPVFFAGLAVFAAGILLVLVNFFASLSRGPVPEETFGMAVAGAGVVFAFASFALSWYFQHSTGKAVVDLERLFWGGGHVLQFTNNISMLVAWSLLSRKVFGRAPVTGKASAVIYLIFLVSIVPAPFVYLVHDTASQAYKESFTALMRWGHGVPTALYALATLRLLLSGRGLPFRRPGLSALILSMVLFTMGGVIGMLIRGVNTIIPAHYHSVIAAITIAFMGLFYEAAPEFQRRVRWPSLASVQPYLYFAGVFLFVTGLFVAGTFGVLRKTYAGEQNLDAIGKVVGMSVMGLGGVVSIAGGVAFVLNALTTLLGRGGRPDDSW